MKNLTRKETLAKFQADPAFATNRRRAALELSERVQRKAYELAMELELYGEAHLTMKSGVPVVVQPETSTCALWRNGRILK